MQIKNKYYPYPVIAYGNDSYENTSFLTDANYEQNAHNLIFTFEAELGNEKLLDMIAAGQVKYAHHIECQQTCFRKLILTDKSTEKIAVHENEVNGLVQICSFLMADQDISKYENLAFSKDYRGFKFDIDRGCIMAIGNQVNINIDKEKEDISKTSSIFSVRRNHNPSDTELKISTTGPKIVILIPEKTCNQYLSLSNNEMLMPVLHSMVVLPALMQVLLELKEAANKNELFNYEEYRWYRSLKKTSERLKINFSEEDIKDMDVFKTAQLFLDVPVVKALNNICSGEEGHDD